MSGHIAGVLETTLIQMVHPYFQLFPDDTFQELLSDVVRQRGLDIQTRCASGEYSRDSMGFVILDPTASISTPSLQAILAIASVGPTGKDFLVNALAKVVEHRDRGVECGVQVYTRPHMLADGDFRYGYSVLLDGTYVGGSGLTEYEDRYQCTLLAADFNLRVAKARKSWEEIQGKGRWYCNQDEPGNQYTETLEQLVPSLLAD